MQISSVSLLAEFAATTIQIAGVLFTVYVSYLGVVAAIRTFNTLTGQGRGV